MWTWPSRSCSRTTERGEPGAAGTPSSRRAGAKDWPYVPRVITPDLLRRPTLPVDRLPFVGRARELKALTGAVDAAQRGRGGIHLIAGEGGVGKTRLMESLRAYAAERGFTQITGRAFQVETGIPYAIFGDGFVPLLREMSAASLQLLSRGGGAELALLFPALRTGEVPQRTSDATELRPRLFDAFSQLLGSLAKKAPTLVVLENLHWADPSSIDLFHFVARSAAAHRLLLVATYSDAHRESQRGLKLLEQSLSSLDVLTRHVLAPLTRAETVEMIAKGFGEPAATIEEFADRVQARTRGNPFFIEETLKALVHSGRLRREGERWVGWATEQLSLPDSIRDALSLRYDLLSEPAQQVVQMAAVVGARVPHTLLERVTDLTPDALLSAIDDLRRERVVEEVESSVDPVYRFTHPMLQEMLYAELGRARAAAMHARIADALEEMYGATAMEHAEEIAVHFRRAESPVRSGRAIRFLMAAGERAVARGSHREAAESLTAALALLESADDAAAREAVLESLGRAKHRLGDYAGAITLFARAIAMAEARGADARVAALERRQGLAWLRRGEFLVALSHHDRGLAAALRAGDKAAEASFHLGRSAGMMDMGDGAGAERAGQLALEIAEGLGEPRLLGRVHQALQALNVWRGPSAAAVLHGQKALEFARTADDVRTMWQAEWVFGFHAGLTGDSAGTLRHIQQAAEFAEQLRSPVLRIWTAEVSIEYRSGIGEWDEALGLADRTIDEARAFSQNNLLPRLLVWSGLMLCGRGEFGKAKERLDEAWHRSGADRAGDGTPLNVHHVVPAHVGLGYYHLYRRDYRTALVFAERGLAIADRTGYTVLAVHRLLPLAAEASLWLRDWDSAAAYGMRLRAAAGQLGHPLALAWADACVALERMLRGDHAGAITQLRQAADALEAIPFVEHAARLRRKLADALLTAGRSDEARAELARCHEVFRRLGAELALDEVREKMRELGMRRLGRGPGGGGLTATELKVARLVAEGRTNPQIGKALSMSPRTASTHIANIYKKLAIGSRHDLTEYVREHGL